MKITIINGNHTDNKYRFDKKLGTLEEKLCAAGHDVTLFRLKEMQIKSCTGCWGCWVKTPGECIIPDDTVQIRQSYIQSGMVVFASPVSMGFTSSLMKMVQDKLIPLLHPYIEIDHHECHHKKRYAKYPIIGLLYEKTNGTDNEDIDIITTIHKRFALNFKTKLAFSLPINDTLDTIVDEINRN